MKVLQEDKLIDLAELLSLLSSDCVIVAGAADLEVWNVVHFLMALLDLLSKVTGGGNDE